MFVSDCVCLWVQTWPGHSTCAMVEHTEVRGQPLGAESLLPLGPGNQTQTCASKPSLTELCPTGQLLRVSKLLMCVEDHLPGVRPKRLVLRPAPRLSESPPTSEIVQSFKSC